jgi:hypothetical protein
MRTPGSKMKKQSKEEMLNEIEYLRGIAFALYKELGKTPQSPESKEPMDNFIKYIMEAL